MRAIGPPLTAEESAAFIAAARSCVNRVKFRHMGRDPKTGMDCAGLAQWAAQQVGRPVWDIPAYGTQPHRDGLRQAMVNNMGEPVPRDSVRPGDVVLMKFDGEPKHVGIIGDYPGGLLSLIHTYGTIKRVTEHRLDAMWRGMIVEVFRP